MSISLREWTTGASRPALTGVQPLFASWNRTQRLLQTVKVQFRVLGPLEAVDEGRPVPLGRRRTRALLAYLLLHANEPVSADRLIDELWPAEAPKTVGAS